MSLDARQEDARSRGFPRVSGDEPVSAAVYDGERLFSPRERG